LGSSSVVSPGARHQRMLFCAGLDTLIGCSSIPARPLSLANLLCENTPTTKFAVLPVSPVSSPTGRLKTPQTSAGWVIRRAWVRNVDESGVDYSLPVSHFIFADVPRIATRDLAAASWQCQKHYRDDFTCVVFRPLPATPHSPMSSHPEVHLHDPAANHLS